MAHDEKDSAHGEHGDHDIAHAVPLPLLFGVLFALLALTGLTVFCAGLGLGHQASFMVAMVIATVKAALVMAIFMHLYWDKRLNSLAFLGSFLFVMLFLGMALTDKSEYKPDIDKKNEADKAAAK